MAHPVRAGRLKLCPQLVLPKCSNLWFLWLTCQETWHQKFVLWIFISGFYFIFLSLSWAGVLPKKSKSALFPTPKIQQLINQREAHKVQVVLVWFPEALSKQLQSQLRGAPAAQHHPENHSGNTSTAVKLLQRCHKLHCQMKNDIFTLQWYCNYQETALLLPVSAVCNN